MDAFAGGLLLEAFASLDDLAHAFRLFEEIESLGLTAGALGLSRFLSELEWRGHNASGTGDSSDAKKGADTVVVVHAAFVGELRLLSGLAKGRLRPAVLAAGAGLSAEAG